MGPDFFGISLYDTMDFLQGFISVIVGYEVGSTWRKCIYGYMYVKKDLDAL